MSEISNTWNKMLDENTKVQEKLLTYKQVNLELREELENKNEQVQ